jgi:hypothetical protein
MRRVVRLVVALAVLSGGLAIGPAAVAVGPGTYTRITSPTGPIYRDIVTSPTLTVSGVTSSDLTSVNIYCYYADDTASFGPINGSAVTVSGGVFSATVTLPFDPNGCILRALPTGSPPTYVASFTGPLLLPFIEQAQTSGGVTIGGDLYGGGSGGAMLDITFDQGDVINPTPVDPSSRIPSPFVLGVAGDVETNNAASTATSLVVDGHFAYTPEMVQTTVHGDTTITYTPPTVTPHYRAGPSAGRQIMVAKVPLLRCSGSDALAPTSTTCPSLLRTGVSVVQTTETYASGQQVLEQFAFASTDGHHHKVSVEFLTVASTTPTGSLGYLLPTGSKKLVTVSPTPHTIRHVQPGIHSTVIKQDIYAADGDPHVSIASVTTSSRPTTTRIYGGDVMTMTVKRSVPAHGSAGFSLEFGIGLKLAAIESLARHAEHALAGHLRITSPKHGATTHSDRVHVTVKATASGNGLPVTLTVNGRKAKLGHHTATTGIYRVVLKLKPGTRTITAHATDAGGNHEKAVRTITVV